MSNYKITLHLEGSNTYSEVFSNTDVLIQTADLLAGKKYPLYGINVTLAYGGERRSWVYSKNGQIVGYANIVETDEPVKY